MPRALRWALEALNDCQKNLSVPWNFIFQLVPVNTRYLRAVVCRVIKSPFKYMGKLLKESLRSNISRYGDGIFVAHVLFSIGTFNCTSLDWLTITLSLLKLFHWMAKHIFVINLDLKTLSLWQGKNFWLSKTLPQNTIQGCYKTHLKNIIGSIYIMFGCPLNYVFYPIICKSISKKINNMQFTKIQEGLHW
jgi:hypothetical protein